MVGFFIAIVSGALMSIQGIFNTNVTKVSGIWASAVFVQFSALIVCLCAWFIVERGKISEVFTVQPKYMLLGGAVGAFITFTVVKAIACLGPAKATLFIVITQITVSYLIELFALFGVDRQSFSWKNAISLAIIYIGVILFQWDK